MTLCPKCGSEMIDLRKKKSEVYIPFVAKREGKYITQDFPGRRVEQVCNHCGVVFFTVDPEDSFLW